MRFLFSRKLVLRKAAILSGICFGFALSFIIIPICRYSLGFTANSVTEENDYEPRLLLKPQSAISRNFTPTITRPRYYATELRIREKLLVVILAAPETLASLGGALNATLSPHINKLIFFTCASSRTSTKNSSNIINFDKITCSHLAFYVLKYLAESHLMLDYDFIFVTRDSTYVRGEHLMALAYHLNSGLRVYLGGSTFGTCSIDAGILMSSNVFNDVITMLSTCASSKTTADVETCFGEAAGLPCSNVVQGQSFYAVSLRQSSNVILEPQTVLKAAKINETLTVYPLTRVDHMYQVHHFFSFHAIYKVRNQLEGISKAVTELWNKGNVSEFAWPATVYPPNFKARRRFDVPRTIYFNNSVQLWTSDSNVIRPLRGADREDLTDIMNKIGSDLYSNTNTSFQLRNGYRTFDYNRGMRYVLDLDVGGGGEVIRRIEAIRPLSATELIPMPYVTEKSHVTLVMPIRSSDTEHVAVFLDVFARVSMQRSENVMLLLVFLYDPTSNQRSGAGSSSSSSDVFAEVKRSANRISNQYRGRSDAKLAMLTIRLRRVDPSEIALTDLIVDKLGNDSLVFFATPDMENRIELLNRIRMNVVQGHLVFAPIPFVQYHPILSDQDLEQQFMELNKDTGSFDALSTDYIGFYTSDYWSARGAYSDQPIVRSSADFVLYDTSEASISLLQLFVASQAVHVLRAPDPDLRVVYRRRSCAYRRGYSALRNCDQSLMSTLASRSQLAKFFLTTSSLSRGTLSTPPPPPQLISNVSVS